MYLTLEKVHLLCIERDRMEQDKLLEALKEMQESKKRYDEAEAEFKRLVESLREKEKEYDDLIQEVILLKIKLKKDAKKRLNKLKD